MSASHPLTASEQNALFRILRALFGPSNHNVLRAAQHLFNTATLAETEALLTDLRRCNRRIQELLAGLAGGVSLAAKGWLRKLLEKLAEELGSAAFSMESPACRNVLAAHRRARILMTFM